MDKRAIAGLLTIGAAALLANEAVAATCALRSSSGTCLFYTNGVEGEIRTDSQGSLLKGPKVKITAVPTPTDPGVPSVVPGVVACGNPGANGWTSPGIQTVYVSDLTVVTTLLRSPEVPIQKSNVSKGVALIVAHALAFEPNSSACPNSGWQVVDAVPCNADITVTLSNDAGTIDSAKFACSLDLQTCSTLAWDNVSQTFNRKPYSCTLTQ